MAPMVPLYAALRSLRSALAPVAVIGVAVLVWSSRPAPPAQDAAAEPLLVPFVLDAVRVPGRVESQVLFYNPREGETAELVALRVRGDGLLLVSVPLAGDVPGSAELGAVNALIERLPEELAHLRRPRAFAAPDAPTFEGAAALTAYRDVARRVEALKAAYAAGEPPPFAQLDFALDYDQLLAPEAPAGTRAEVVIEVDYVLAGVPRTASVARGVTKLAERRPLPFTLAGTGLTSHAGDLHVHSCHGEAVNACAPSSNCGAESLQTSGSFSYAQLATQYQALGLEWITATDHSYCIDSPGEYATVVAECAALTSASFLVMPDIELSSDESGAQQGGDSGDLLCLFSGGSAHSHMGAHGISAHKPGGSQGFLGWCGGAALQPFLSNVAAIRAEGGYTLANHPTAGSFGWNSFAATPGIEGNGLHGVEIWNGAAVSGQGGDVGRWVAWLLAGRILYAYSGSDTHDQAFAFGANNVLLAGPLSIDAVEAALKSGRSYVSEQHSLVLEVGYDGLTLPMGSLQSLPASQPASAVTADVHYDFGADTGTISVFRGRVGDAVETLLCQSGPLTGAGVFSCGATLDTVSRTYYRAYAEAGGKASYTNPVFFFPGACAWIPYAVAAGGANEGTLASDTSPAIGTLNRLTLAGFDAASPLAILAVSNLQLDPPIPLLGGFLAIGPALFNLTLPLTGGGIELLLALPLDSTLVGATLYWQAIAIDFGQPELLAFSNGLEMPLCQGW